LADEVPLPAKCLEKAIGRKLAARVLRSWTEDFVDEDTGEVVTIERNEIILERDVVLDEENIEQILEAEQITSSSRKKISRRITRSSTIPCKKTLPAQKWKRFNISTDSFEVPIHRMKKQLAVSSINSSSPISATTSEK
jgi:hypothetical protein